MERRVLLADDTEDIRVLLRLSLGAAGFTVVGEAADGDEALAQWHEHRDAGVHALVLDHRMPRRTGLEVAREVLATDPEQRVVLFSASVDPELRTAAAAAGVTAVVDKDDLGGLGSHPALA